MLLTIISVRYILLPPLIESRKARPLSLTFGVYHIFNDMKTRKPTSENTDANSSNGYFAIRMRKVNAAIVIAGANTRAFSVLITSSPLGCLRCHGTYQTLGDVTNHQEFPPCS